MLDTIIAIAIGIFCMIVPLALSWAFVNFLVWLIFLLIGWDFTFIPGTIIWLVAILLKFLFD